MKELIEKLRGLYVDAENEYQNKFNEDWENTYKDKYKNRNDMVEMYTYDLFFADGKRHMAFEAYKMACDEAGVQPYTLNFD